MFWLPQVIKSFFVIFGQLIYFVTSCNEEKFSNWWNIGHFWHDFEWCLCFLFLKFFNWTEYNRLSLWLYLMKFGNLPLRHKSLWISWFFGRSAKCFVRFLSPAKISSLKFLPGFPWTFSNSLTSRFQGFPGLTNYCFQFGTSDN